MQRYYNNIFGLCETCENATLIARVVRKNMSVHPTTPHGIVERYLCNLGNTSCINNVRDECSPTQILMSLVC